MIKLIYRNAAFFQEAKKKWDFHPAFFHLKYFKDALFVAVNGKKLKWFNIFKPNDVIEVIYRPGSGNFELLKNSYSRSLGRNFGMVIDIKHSYFDNNFYFINDNKPLEIEGIKYVPYPFDVVLPAQTEMQGTQIVFSNVQNLAANEIKKTIYSNENILLDLSLVNIETEKAEKYSTGLFELVNVQITPESITGNINIRHNLNINIGASRYSNQLFPNLSH